ncbi:MAG: hypothetical protein ACRDTH_05060 [Pseudonocardiaceae bacterium]
MDAHAPPRLLICLSGKNHTYRVVTGSEALAVHFLPRPVAARREGSQPNFEFHRAKTITPGHPA